MFVKVSRKGIFLALMYGMLTPGLALGMAGIPNEYGDDSKYDANPQAQQDIGDYWEDQQWATPESKPGADAGADRYDGVAGYDAKLDPANVARDDDGGSEDSPIEAAPAKKVVANPFGHTSPATLTTEVQHFLRYTERQDTSGRKSDDEYYDSQNVEGIQHTIAREMQECVKHLGLLEAQIEKLNGFISAKDPVKAFNDDRGWKLWKSKAKSVQDIINDREVEDKQLAIAEQHLSLMMQYSAQLANIEIDSYQKQITDIDNILRDPKTAVAEYNKKFSWYQYFSKVSNVDGIKKQKASLEQSVKYWNGYKEQILKIVPEHTYKKMISQSFQYQMKRGGFGVGVASPKIHVSPTPFMGKKKPVEVRKTPELPPTPPTPGSPLVKPADTPIIPQTTTTTTKPDTGVQLLRINKLMSLLSQHASTAQSFSGRF